VRLALGLLPLLAGCSVVLSPNDDIVKRLGVLEDKARVQEAWSNKFAADVSAAINQVNAAKADKAPTVKKE
jgi:hypothetical protein